MKVYVVEEVHDLEYGNMHISAIFGKKEDAENYVEENGSTWTHWADGEEYPTMRIREWEVQ